MSDSNDAPDGFLSRWSRRKVSLRDGREGLPEPAPSATVRAEPVLPNVLSLAKEAPALPAPSTSSGRTDRGTAHADPAPAAPPPTLDDVAQLTASSDYRRFVAPDATPAVKNAALKKLFTDPHFNVMDGLDTYIDDYGKPDPIPASMLRQMVQSQALGLFADEAREQPPPAPAAAGATPDGVAPVDAAQSPSEPATPIADDQDVAVRLQPLDAAGPTGDPGGAEPDPGRQR